MIKHFCNLSSMSNQPLLDTVNTKTRFEYRFFRGCQKQYSEWPDSGNSILGPGFESAKDLIATFI